MSATGRGRRRRPSDDYPTPNWVVHRLLDRLGDRLPIGRWLEPTAGDGAILRAVECPDIEWTAMEVQPKYESLLRETCSDVVIGDFLVWRRASTDGYFDVAITNPPYSLAAEVISHALTMANIVVMLLRVNFLGSDKREDFFNSLPSQPWIGVLPNRPSFDGLGTDATEYAWFVWGIPELEGRWERLSLTPAAVRRAEKLQRLASVGAPR